MSSLFSLASLPRYLILSYLDPHFHLLNSVRPELCGVVPPCAVAWQLQVVSWSYFTLFLTRPSFMGHLRLMYNI